MTLKRFCFLEQISAWLLGVILTGKLILAVYLGLNITWVHILNKHQAK